MGKMLWWMYYTSSNPMFAKEVEFSSTPLKKYGVNLEIVEIEEQGDWMRNCLWRCQHLAQQIDRYPEDFLGILDSDLIILKDPVLLKQPFEEDVMVDDHGTNAPLGKRFSAGIISFAPTEEGRACLRRWAEDAKNNVCYGQKLQEQWLLYRNLAERYRPSLFRLNNMDYNHVPRGEEDCSKMTILHTHQQEQWCSGHNVVVPCPAYFGAPVRIDHPDGKIEIKHEH